MASAEVIFDEAFLQLLESIALSFRRARGGGRRGNIKGRRRGAGNEFADYRPYAAGDDIRGLDWPLYQRLGKLLVRLYDEQEDQRLYLLVDSSLSMAQGGQAQWRLARQLIAALAYLGLCQLESVSVIALHSGGIERLSPTQGKGKIFRIFRFLSNLKAHGDTNLGKSIRQFLGTRPAPGVAFLLSDFLDPHGLYQGVDALRFHRFETVVLRLQGADPFVKAWGELQLSDCETKEVEVVRLNEQEVSMSLEREAQQAEELRTYCVKNRVSYALVQGAPLLKDVLFSLRSKGFLR